MQVSNEKTEACKEKDMMKVTSILAIMKICCYLNYLQGLFSSPIKSVTLKPHEDTIPSRK